MIEVPEQDVGNYEITLRDIAGNLLPATIELGCRDWTDTVGRHTDCRIKLTWVDGIIEETSWHFFESFKQVRKRLAVQRLLPLCYGASRRVIITGMAIDMGLGRRIYRVNQEGEQFRPVVDIFKTGEDVEPVSVEEQEQFQAEWWELERGRRAY